jgi:hypothetical protein
MHFVKPSGLPRRLRLLAMTAVPDCRTGFASAALRPQLKPCCNDGNPKCRHCEQSEAIQHDKRCILFKTPGLPRRPCLLAMTRHLDCRVGFTSAALRSQLKPCCNDGNPKCRHCERSETIQHDKRCILFKTPGLPRRLRLLAMTRCSALPHRLRLCRASLAAETLLQ